MSQKGIGSKMKVRAKDFALLAVIFAGLVMMEVVFRGATIGFEATDYLFTEILLITLMSLSCASLIFFFRTAIPGRGGKIIYGALIAAVTVLFLSQTVYYTIFDTYYTVYSFMNGAQVVEFMSVIINAIFRCCLLYTSRCV